MRATILLGGWLCAACGDDTAAVVPDGPAAIDAPAQPDAYVLPCEPTDGTGCDAGQKCTLVPTGGSNPAFAVGCASLNGSLEAYATDCGPAYDDNCGPGLFCYGGREADGSYCRPVCHSDADCPGTADKCVWFLAGPPPTGYCAFECMPFTGDCPGGANCSAIYLDADMTTWWVDCRDPGVTPVGTSCVDVYECVADAWCWGGRCRRLCDATHPCASGACEPLTGLPSGGGLCT